MSTEVTVTINGTDPDTTYGRETLTIKVYPSSVIMTIGNNSVRITKDEFEKVVKYTTM